MKLQIRLFAALLLLAITAGAQNHHTVYGGYTNYRLVNKDDDPTTFHGFHVGWEYSHRLLSDVPVYANIGVAFYWNWNRYHNTEALQIDDELEVENVGAIPVQVNGHAESISNTNYGGIRVPLSFSYEFLIPNTKLYVIPMAGFHVNINISARQFNQLNMQLEELTAFPGETYAESVPYDPYIVVQATNETKLIGDTDLGRESYHRMQAGWQVGLNLRLSHYNAGFTYEQEFMRLCSAYTSNAFYVRLGYTF